MKESVQMIILVSFLPIVTNMIKVMFACDEHWSEMYISCV